MTTGTEPLIDSACAICGDTPSVVAINGRPLCINHLDDGMRDAFAPLREAFAIGTVRAQGTFRP